MGLRELAQALKRIVGVDVCFRCIYAVEKDPKACKFMMSMSPEDRPSFLFSDAKDMLGDSVYDQVTASWVQVPQAAVLICGVECGTLSSLSVARKRQRDCISTGEGGTGSTFGYLVNFVKKHSQDLLMVLVENVPLIDVRRERDGLVNPIEDAKAMMSTVGFYMPFSSVFSARAFGGDVQERSRFYGPFVHRAIQADIGVWNACLAALATPANQCAELAEHLIPSQVPLHHPWLSRDMVTKGKKPRAAPKEMYKAQEKYTEREWPFPPPLLHQLAHADFDALGLPRTTVMLLDILEQRQQVMLYYFIRDGALQDAATRGAICVLPVEKSWQYFRPVEGRAMTLCASSHWVIADFSSPAPIFRPLLPCEMFSFQGMPLADLFPELDDPEAVLTEVLTFADARRIAGSAFHIPSCIAAFLGSLLSISDP